MAFLEKWWISPRGQIEPVKGTMHINDIMEDPQKFGFSREELEGIYEKHGEKLGVEGLAREEIIKMAMARGWIRARGDANRGLYLETGNFDKAKKLIGGVVEDFRTVFKKAVWEPIMIMDYRTRTMIQSTLQEIEHKIFSSSISVAEWLFARAGLSSVFETDDYVPDGMMLLRHSFRVESTSMSKIFRYVQEGVQFGTISAFSGGFSTPENRQRNQELYQDLREMGYRPIKLDGGWFKDPDAQGHKEVVPEKSFLVRGISLPELLSLGKKYGQMGVLYHDANQFGVWHSRGDKYGEQDMKFTRDPEKMFNFDPEYAYSELHGRKRPYPEGRVKQGERTNPTKTKKWAFVDSSDTSMLARGGFQEEVERRVVISSEVAHTMMSRMMEKYNHRVDPPDTELVISWKERLVPDSRV